MNRRKKLWISIILAIALVAVLFDYPDYWNKASDSVNGFFKNQQIGWVKNINIPHFPSKPFKLGLDLQGGTHLIYEADLSKVNSSDRSNSMQGLRDVIERRINLFGVAEPVVQVQEKGGSHRLIVELAGVKNISEAIKMIGETPFLEFKEERTDIDTAQKNKIIEAQNRYITALQKGEEINLTDEEKSLLNEDVYVSTNLTGQYLTKAVVEFNPQTYKPEVSLEFNSEGAKLFEEITARNVGRSLPIYIDYQLLSAPNVEQAISGGKAVITSPTFTLEEVKSLANSLSAGALPVPIKIISQQNVEASLGKIDLEKSLGAGLISFLLIAVFMILFYRLPGLLSIIALGAYAALVLAIFKLIPVTLTLSGIAGFLLSIGMAIDANILIFSRMKEERKLGKSLFLVIEDGFKRAWPSIRDGNYTTILTCIILFVMGTGFVKGFALTLLIGLVLSLFSSMVISRVLMLVFANTKMRKWNFIWK